MNLPVGAIAGVIGRKTPSIRKHPDAVSLQADLRHPYGIWVSVVGLYDGDKANARVSLNALNRHLQYLVPIELFEKGDLPPLEGLIGAMTARQPA